MTRYAGAIWDPLGPQAEPRMVSHNIVCVHTMAGSLEGARAYFKQQGYGGTESHFGMGGSGRTYQWQDLDFQADANYNGNPEVISIETADMGESFPRWSGSDVPAWTTDQIEKLIELITWLCKRYNIPAQLIPDTKPGRRGLAYHRQGIDGNFNPPAYRYPGRVSGGVRWSSSSGKVCPGDRRITQFIEEVIPGVQRNLGSPIYVTRWRLRRPDGTLSPAVGYRRARRWFDTWMGRLKRGQEVSLRKVRVRKSG